MRPAENAGRLYIGSSSQPVAILSVVAVVLVDVKAEVVAFVSRKKKKKPKEGEGKKIVKKYSVFFSDHHHHFHFNERGKHALYIRLSC